MREAILLALMFITAKANATIYYVSNNGDDNNMGTSICESWRTLSKVNSYPLFTDNDSVLFKAGDTWNGKLIVAHSNLYFGKYGGGINPLITGFKLQGGFVQNGNIWTATADSAVKVLNTVMLNGKFAFKSRYPNSTYIIPIGPWVNTYVKTTLPDYPNYVGDEIVVRSTQWVIDVRKITSQSAGVFGFAQKLTYPTTYGGRGIFFQNGVHLIDSVGEFSFDSSNKSLSVYSIGSPTVQISSIDTLVLVNHKDNVTFDNIGFTGANMYTFKLDTSRNFTIKNCSINYAGDFGIYASKSRDIIIDNDSIQNCYNSGLLLGSEYTGKLGIITDTCKRANVTNNFIKNIGKVAGMASNGLYVGDGEITHGALWVSGDSALIKNNRIDSNGGIPIRVIGKMDSVCYNYITNFQFIKVDGGGIRTFQGSGLSPIYNQGVIIYRNIIGNGIGSSYAQGIIGSNFAPGIYLDLYSNGITVKENTVFNCLGGALFQLSDSNNIIRDNNFEDSIDNISQVFSGTKNIFLRNNVFYQRHKSRCIMYAYPFTQNSDSNYFLKPIAPTTVMFNYNGKNYTFPHYWIDSTGWDINSKGSPLGIIGTYGKLYINPTMKDSTININGSFVDARGNLINNSFTLEPYASITLFPSSYYTPIAKTKQQ